MGKMVLLFVLCLQTGPFHRVLPEDFNISLCTNPFLLLLDSKSVPVNSALDNSIKENRVLGGAKSMGTLLGIVPSTLNLYHITKDKGMSLNVFATAVPPLLIGGIVGRFSTEWTVKRIIENEPEPIKAFFKGIGYGAVNGIVNCAANYLPFFITGYFLKTVDFNVSGKISWQESQGTPFWEAWYMVEHLELFPVVYQRR